ncbi:MAG: hypothetical protein Q9192_004049 [Flavoplaca navasiana]
MDHQIYNKYSIPEGLHPIPTHLLDLCPDAETDHDLLHPPPISNSEKNIWFFWHSGFKSMHGYTQRNIRAWHRRFSKLGWIGDLDRLWNETVGDADSEFEVLSYDTGSLAQRSLTNYFLASCPGNPLFSRCHKLLLELWAADGGKAGTEGMHASELLKGVPLMQGGFTIEEGDRVIGAEEVRKMLTDYIIQGQVMTMVMGLVDEEDGWDGPKYVEEHVYAMEFMVGAQLVDELTAWDCRLAFRLLSLSLPKDGEMESEEQVQARGIVEGCLQRSFGFKLAHGMIEGVWGDVGDFVEEE